MFSFVKRGLFGGTGAESQKKSRSEEITSLAEKEVEGLRKSGDSIPFTESRRRLSK